MTAANPRFAVVEALVDAYVAAVEAMEAAAAGSLGSLGDEAGPPAVRPPRRYQIDAFTHTMTAVRSRYRDLTSDKVLAEEGAVLSMAPRMLEPGAQASRSLRPSRAARPFEQLGSTR